MNRENLMLHHEVREPYHLPERWEQKEAWLRKFLIVLANRQ